MTCFSGRNALAELSVFIEIARGGAIKWDVFRQHLITVTPNGDWKYETLNNEEIRLDISAVDMVKLGLEMVRFGWNRIGGKVNVSSTMPAVVRCSSLKQ